MDDGDKWEGKVVNWKSEFIFKSGGDFVSMCCEVGEENLRIFKRYDLKERMVVEIVVNLWVWVCEEKLWIRENEGGNMKECRDIKGVVEVLGKVMKVRVGWKVKAAEIVGIKKFWR
ncbi:hypothetical protein ACRFB9_28200 [Klebsiella pneumoniae]